MCVYININMHTFLKANQKSNACTEKSKFIPGPYHQLCADANTFANFFRVSFRDRTLSF